MIDNQLIAEPIHTNFEDHLAPQSGLMKRSLIVKEQLRPPFLSAKMTKDDSATAKSIVSFLNFAATPKESNLHRWSIEGFSDFIEDFAIVIRFDCIVIESVTMYGDHSFIAASCLQDGIAFAKLEMGAVNYSSAQQEQLLHFRNLPSITTTGITATNLGMSLTAKEAIDSLAFSALVFLEDELKALMEMDYFV